MDSNIQEKAVSAAGQNYANIVALSSRQSFGAMGLTIPGNILDTDDFVVFMKEIFGDGNVNNSGYRPEDQSLGHTDSCRTL